MITSGTILSLKESSCGSMEERVRWTRMGGIVVPRTGEGGDDVVRDGGDTMRKDGALSGVLVLPIRYWSLSRPSRRVLMWTS